jgi:hypothetical protein
MDRRQVLTTGALAAVAAAATSTTMRAAAHGGEGLEGSWFGTVSAINPPLGLFNDLITFHPGGLVIESRRYLVKPTPFGDLLETTGHGAWETTGRRQFEAFFRFLLQNAMSGQPIGTDNIRLSLTLDPETGTLTGTFVSQIKDTSDVVLLEVTGDYSATRIEV